MNSATEQGNARTARVAIAVVVLAAVALRVAVALAIHSAHPERVAFNDSPSYLGPAQALVEDRQYDQAPGSDTPEFVRTPGYPAFIAAVFWLTGDNEHTLVGIQAALSGLSVLLAILLARRLTSSLTLALSVGVLLALDPFQTVIAGWLLTESLATTLVTLTGYCLVRLVQGGYPARWGVAAGLSLAAATFVRPTTLYFPLVIGAVLAIAILRNAENRRALLRGGLAILLPCLTLTGAWSVRNHNDVGSWRFSGIEALNMYWYRAASVVAPRDGLSFKEAQVRLTEDINEGVTPRVDAEDEGFSAGDVPPAWENDQGEYYDKAQREGLEIFLSEPVRAARVTAKGVYQQFVQSGWGDASEYVAGRSAPAPIAALGLLVVWSIEALGLLGMAMSLRRRTPNRLAYMLPIALVAYTVIVSAGPEAAAGYRFRAPLWPIWCTFAVLGARELVTAVLRRRAARQAAGFPDDELDSANGSSELGDRFTLAGR